MFRQISYLEPELVYERLPGKKTLPFFENSYKLLERRFIVENFAEHLYKPAQ